MDAASNSSHVEHLPLLCYFLLHCYDAARFLFVIPPSVFILCQAFKQWRRQHSFSSTSHSDILTFHNAAVEVLWASGTFLAFWHYAHALEALKAGHFLMSVSYFGQSLFHMLTCVERYLAVVHPITYRGLKNSRGARIRDVSVGCVWSLCFILSIVFVLADRTSQTVSLLVLSGFSLITVSFCSVSVLCVLIRPGPGDVGGDRERVDQLKLRAFYTLMLIVGAIWLWFIPFFVSTAVVRLNHPTDCVRQGAVYWFNLPSSLVLPLLYLHRTGTLPCCRSNG